MKRVRLNCLAPGGVTLDWAPKLPRAARRAREMIPDDELARNVLLCRLGEAGRIVARCGTVVSLAPDERIYAAGEPIEDVFFPLDAAIAIVMYMKDGHQIAIGAMGREGTSAYPLLLGTPTSENDWFCKVPGSAIKIRVEVFRSLMSADPAFRAGLDLDLRGYVSGLGRLAACNRLHNVYQRCACWLLLTSDRVGLKPILVTHEFLALMLGTDRSGVSVAAGMLKRTGSISYAYGAVTINDRARLEAESCECYTSMRKPYGASWQTVSVIR